MGTPLKVGVIGASAERGWAKISHVPAVQGLEGLELAAVATNDQKSADAAAKAFGVTGYADAAALFRDPAIDLVAVAVNVPAHRDLVLDALKAGKHLYCEWPLGRTLAEAEELAAAARAASVHAAIGLQTRQNPAARKARELLDAAAIGRVLSANVLSTAMAFGPEVESAMAFGEKVENGTTLVSIQGGHTIDLAIALLGELGDVAALATTQYPEVRVGDNPAPRPRPTPDHILMQARLASGAALTVEVAGGRPPKDTPFRFEVIGERGSLLLEGGAPRGFQSGRLRLLLNGEELPIDEGEAAGMIDTAANVAGVYARLRDDINAQSSTVAGFDHAVRLTRLIDDMLGVIAQWRPPPCSGLAEALMAPAMQHGIGSRRPTEFGRLVPPDPDWLALQQPEPILFPDLPIIDPHHHLWDAPGLSSPGFRYMLEDYIGDAVSGHNVVGTVYADCMSMYRATGPEQFRPVGETEFALGAGAISRSGRYGPVSVAAAIFGYADLGLGAAVEEVLAAHMQAGNGRFKGVRYAASWNADSTILNYQPNRRAHLLADPNVLDGLRTLAALGLTYDSLTWFTQLDEVAAAADTVPNLTIVVNHCGGPLGYGPYAGRETENFGRWKADIVKVAQRPNVVCKIGGVLMRGAAYDFIHAAAPPTSEELAKAWRPWSETCIEAFGPGRCMFESNFPLEKLGTGFAVLWNTFKRIAANASDHERSDLFAGTARRTYRLDI